MIQLVCQLAVDTRSAAPGCHSIFAGVALEAVLLPHFSSQKKEWDAGSKAGEKEVQGSTLTSPVGILAEKAAPAESAA